MTTLDNHSYETTLHKKDENLKRSNSIMKGKKALGVATDITSLMKVKIN